jgi:hypothetical protein
VVDIGGSIGALVVNTDQALDGAQIEIRPVGAGPSAQTHTIVRAREIPGGGVVYAGVFPSLAAGEYTLLAWGSLPETAVRVEGGSVTQISW